MCIGNAAKKIILALACLSVGHLPAAWAQNLLVNGNFANSLDSWNIVPLAFSEWSPVDSDNSPSSGSIHVINSAAGGRVLDTAVLQCFPLIQGGLYTVSADVLVPSGQATTGHMVVNYVAYPGTTCSDGTGGFTSGGFFAPSTGTWQRSATMVQIANSNISGPTSFQVILLIEKIEAGGTFEGYLDNLSVVHETVFADGFGP